MACPGKKIELLHGYLAFQSDLTLRFEGLRITAACLPSSMCWAVPPPC